MVILLPFVKRVLCCFAKKSDNMFFTIITAITDTQINLPEAITFSAYAWLVPLISSGISAISSGIGAAKAAREREKSEALQRSRYEEAKRMFDVEYNKNYFDTDTAKGAINIAKQNLKERFSALNNSAIKTGQTPESRLAAAENANKTYSNFLTSLASQGTAYKQHLLDKFNSQQQFYDNLYYNNREAAAQSYYNAGQNIGSAVGNAGQAIAAGAENKKAITENANPTTETPPPTPQTPPVNNKKLNQWTNTNHIYFPNSYIDGIKHIGSNRKNKSSLDDWTDNSFEAVINRITKRNNNLYK
jgi:hypothetical protein